MSSPGPEVTDDEISRLSASLTQMSEKVIREPNPILGINWINPKYFVGAELKVLVESVELIKGEISLSVIESGDEEIRHRIAEQLRDLENDNNSYGDFSQVPRKSITSAYGKSLYMTELRENVNIMCRAVVPSLTALPQHPPGEVKFKNDSASDTPREVETVYLMDYGKYQSKVGVLRLRLLVKPSVYSFPPMSVRVVVTDQTQDLQALTRKLRGQRKKIIVTAVEVKTLDYGRIKETWVNAEFI